MARCEEDDTPNTLRRREIDVSHQNQISNFGSSIPNPLISNHRLWPEVKGKNAVVKDRSGGDEDLSSYSGISGCGSVKTAE